MFLGVDDFTAVDQSAVTGAVQTSSLSGTRNWHLRLDFNVLRESDGTLGKFEALVASLRGRANRVWIAPRGQRKPRGSFPTFEALPNNAYQAGTAGLTSSGAGTAAILSLSVYDRILRAGIPDGIGNNWQIFNAFTAVQYAPYALKTFFRDSSVSGAQLRTVLYRNGDSAVGNTVTGPGMSTGAIVSNVTNPTHAAEHLTAGAATQFFDVGWTHASRCALVDNGVNQLLNSDTPGGTSWTATHATGASNSSAAPDGTTTAFKLTEDATTNIHSVAQAFSVSSSSVDATGSIYVAAGSLRTKCYIQLSDGISSAATQWFDLSAVSLLTLTLGGTAMVEARATIQDVGNNWRRITLTCRKTSASTSITMTLGATTTDNVVSYLGSAASSAILMWRGSATGGGQVGSAVRAVQTLTLVSNGTGQTGTSLNLKALPANTQGLLLPGDMAEIQMPNGFSQLVRITSRLDSDAAGLGLMRFENALRYSPGDAAAVIVHRPMCRWILSTSNIGIEYAPGIFGQASLEFIEAP